MNHDIKTHLADLIRTALAHIAPDQTGADILLERPKQAAHGDFVCNVAMQLARALKRNPRDLVQELVAALPASPFIAKVDIAGAGFINFHLQPAAKLALRDRKSVV